jgi:hypothetical protein
MKKNKPVNYVEIRNNNKDLYQKYIEEKKFKRKDFFKLLSKISNGRKNELKNLKERYEFDGNLIYLDYVTGTYCAKIYFNFDYYKYSWMAEKLLNDFFGLVRQQDESENYYFFKKYNQMNVLQLSDFFIKLKTKDDKRIFGSKKVIDMDNVFTDIKDTEKKIGALMAYTDRLLDRQSREDSYNKVLGKFNKHANK